MRMSRSSAAPAADRGEQEKDKSRREAGHIERNPPEQ